MNDRIDAAVAWLAVMVVMGGGFVVAAYLFRAAWRRFIGPAD